jgi:outer membrane lipoprotein LolB
VTRLALVLLAGLLAGCAGLGERPPAPTAGTAGIAGLTAWVAAGRLAVAAGGEGASGGFVWRQQGAETRLQVRGPLGAGAFEIASDGGQLSITDAAGQVAGAAAHDALRRRLGTDLPLASLRYWMIGLPDPTATGRVTESPTAPLRIIDQHGWTIAYDAFVTSDGLSLPARVTATSGDVRLRLTVSDWADLQVDPE